MPIEINELIVRARVSEDERREGGSSQPQAGIAQNQQTESVQEMERTVKEIQEILKRKNER
ncbi:MAG: hypothetical protein HUU01_18595 [Saprospiraceae bacterium]|nr:hypothetical protein [Saprospiraceae bacterium]